MTPFSPSKAGIPVEKSMLNPLPQSLQKPRFRWNSHYCPPCPHPVVKTMTVNLVCHVPLKQDRPQSSKLAFVICAANLRQTFAQACPCCLLQGSVLNLTVAFPCFVYRPCLRSTFACALTDQGDDICTASVQGPSVPDSLLSVGLEFKPLANRRAPPSGGSSNLRNQPRKV